jgi:hypothetical protein
MRPNAPGAAEPPIVQLLEPRAQHLAAVCSTGQPPSVTAGDLQAAAAAAAGSGFKPLRAAAADAQSATALCRTPLLLLLLLLLDTLQLAILASNLFAVFKTGQLPIGLLCTAGAAAADDGRVWGVMSPCDCLRAMCEMLRAL